MDVILHVWVCLCGRWLPGRFTKLSFRHVIPRLIPLNWRVIDRSDRQLTMQHELFRHIEVELFVPGRHLKESIDVTRELIEACSIKQGHERYVHHYPICVRRVLQDATLVSPASRSPELRGDESWYTISCISAYSNRSAEHRLQRIVRDFNNRGLVG